MAIINNIEGLRTVVKVNSALQWDVIEPYYNDARDSFLVYYLGEELVAKIETDKPEVLFNMARRAVGPLTIMLATPELGIMIGDSGITVQNDQGKRSPASEAKIANAQNSFRTRGYQALDRLLEHLEKHITDYPEWAQSRFCTIQKTCFIQNARMFQDVGLIDIDYSIITYLLLLPTIRQLQERHVCEMLGEKLYASLCKNESPSEKETILIELIIRYLANKTIEVYTSKASRQQRTQVGRTEFKPVIRPLFEDLEESGNFYGNQAEYYAGKIHNYLVENAEDLGITVQGQKIEWNSKEKKVVSFLT